MPTIPIKCVHTRTRKLVDLNDVKPDDIDLDDICWSLAGINRWGGHGCRTYFVTDHAESVYKAMREDSIHNRNLATPIELFWGLLHDGHEAYSNDLSAPLKYYLAQFTNALTLLEQRIDKAIAQHFGISEIPYNESMIHEYDMLAREQEYGFLFDGKSNGLLHNTGDRSTQEVRAKRFKGYVEKALEELRDWMNKPQIKFTAKQAETPAAPQARKPIVEYLLESLSAYQKENPHLKVTLTIQ
jgi:hypothetical protein